MALDSRAPLKRFLAGGEIHGYRVPLAAGQYAGVTVDQQGIDVVVRVTSPDGRRLFEMDGPNGSLGTETVSVIAAQTGEYVFEVLSLERMAPRGGYEIRVERARPSVPADQTRVAAERARADASRLYEEATGGSRREAIARRKEALRLWRQLGLPREQAIELVGLAEAYASVGENERALEGCGKSLALARSTGDRATEFLALRTIGYIHHFLGEPEKALEPLGLALALFPSLHIAYAPERAFTLNDLAHAFWLLGQFEKALENDFQALSLARGAGDRRQEAWALKNLSQVYWSMGELRQALDYGRSALELARAFGDRHLAGHTLLALGSIYRAAGEDAKSLEAFREALALRKAMGSRQWEAQALASIGLLHLAQGETRQAIDELDRALELARAVDDRRAQGRALVCLGQAWQRLGDPARARATWDQALALSRETGDRESEASAEAAMAGAARDEGRLDEARGHIERALERVESLRAEVSAEDLRASFLASHQDHYRFATDLLLQLDRERPREGFDAAAFQSAERARARALVEAIVRARSDVSGSLQPDLAKRRAHAAAQIVRFQRRLALPELPAEERRKANAGLAEAEAEYDRFIAEARRLHPGYAALRYPEPWRLSAAQRLLDRSTALISYFFGAQSLYAFHVTAGEFGVDRLPVSPRELSGRVENFVELISDGSSAGPPGDRLYRDLLQPVLRRLPAGIRRLILVPDGVLHDLPFEALRFDDGRFSIEKYTIAYVSSATTLAALRTSGTRASPERADLLAFANPDRPGGARRSGEAVSEATRSLHESDALALGGLPYSEEEVRAIGRYAGSGTRVYTGAEASERRVKQERLDRFRILHFATHGLINSQDPSRSALLFAASADEDGFLQTREIYGLKLASDLVVLSACQTARGRLLAGEGVQSLARAFFSAGARSVVASLWRVNDRSTAELMSSFYRHLARGEPKAEALRSAKLDLLSRPGSSPPRDWAAFILLGEPDALVPIGRRPARTAWLALFAGLLGIALAGVVRWRINGRRLRERPVSSPPSGTVMK